jgi:ribonuclease HII
MNAQADRFEFERAFLSRGTTCIAGADEVGCGPLAGPVVAAAAVLPFMWVGSGLPRALKGLNDSKQLTEQERERFFAVLTSDSQVRFAVARIESDVIDRLNILRAAHEAIKAAVAQLDPPPQHVLVDGKGVRTLAFPQTAIIKGDQRSYSIAAASVLAKVTRDRLMVAYDQRWPAYGFARHKGYGTSEHLAALAKHGPCPIHRLSFAPVKPAVTPFSPSPP